MNKIYLFKCILLVLLISSCRGRPPKPDWEIWAGHPTDGVIRRTQDVPPRELSCDDPKFKQFMCMTYEDFKRNTLKIIEACKKWDGSTQMNMNEMAQDPIYGPMFFGSGHR